MGQVRGRGGVSTTPQGLGHQVWGGQRTGGLGRGEVQARAEKGNVRRGSSGRGVEKGGAGCERDGLSAAGPSGQEVDMTRVPIDWTRWHDGRSRIRPHRAPALGSECSFVTAICTHRAVHFIHAKVLLRMHVFLQRKR